jgi:EpsI family protein
LIYGWLFFGVVIALLFWIGARWRQDDLPVPAHSNSRLGVDDGPAGHSVRRAWAPALAAIVLMVMWQPLRAHFDTSESTRPVRLAPLASQDGWTPTSEEVSAWKPDLSGFRAELRQSFAKGDQRVALVVSFFRDQTAETKAISSTNQVVNTTNRIWRRIDIVGTPLQLGGSTVVPREATLVGPGPLERLEAIQWYWVDGHVTSKDYEAKLYQAMSVLRGHGDSVAWVIVYAPAGQGVAQASQNVRRFAMAMGRSLDGMLREAATQ